MKIISRNWAPLWSIHDCAFVSNSSMNIVHQLTYGLWTIGINQGFEISISKKLQGAKSGKNTRVTWGRFLMRLHMPLFVQQNLID